MVYNSKADFYEKKVEFYDKDVRGVITEINETRGTKVYLENSYFFYLDQLRPKSLKVGDSIDKTETIISVYERNSTDKYEYLNKVKVLKPEDNYFEFFFGL